LFARVLSDRQVLTPLQVILKKTAEAKELAAACSKESAKAKAGQKKFFGKVEKQFRMRGPSPATSDDEIEIRSVHEASEAWRSTTAQIHSF